MKGILLEGRSIRTTGGVPVVVRLGSKARAGGGDGLLEPGRQAQDGDRLIGLSTLPLSQSEFLLVVIAVQADLEQP